jgi:hypothetical protein
VAEVGQAGVDPAWARVGLRDRGAVGDVGGDPRGGQEILAALSLLAASDIEAGLRECPDTIRQSIASTWLKVLNGEP